MVGVFWALRPCNYAHSSGFHLHKLLFVVFAPSRGEGGRVGSAALSRAADSRHYCLGFQVGDTRPGPYLCVSLLASARAVKMES